MTRHRDHREPLTENHPDEGQDEVLAHAQLTARAAKNAGGALAIGGVALAAAWAGGGGAAVVAALGPSLSTLAPLQAAAIGAGLIVPAALIAFCGFAARENARTRAQAQRLADAADRLLTPAPHAESTTRRLGMAVRGEIVALERAIEEALSRLESVETVIARQAQAVDQTSTAAQRGAGEVVGALERERALLSAIVNEIKAQGADVGAVLGARAETIARASSEIERNLARVEDLLEQRLSGFAAAAALIGDRTEALTRAAETSQASAAQLDASLTAALEALAEATSLTDGARQSAEAATAAASATAGALRDTTLRAVDDARRAADVIRQEAQAAEREANSVLLRLRETADKARAAQPPVVSTMALAPDRSRELPAAAPPAPAPAPAIPPAPAAVDTTPPSPRKAPEIHAQPDELTRPYFFGHGSTTAADQPAVSVIGNGGFDMPALPALAPQAPPAAEPQRRSAWPAFASHFRGGGRQEAERTPASEAPVRESSEGALDAIFAQAGVTLESLFTPGDLDRIEIRARGGVQARRRAVREAAADSLRRIALCLQDEPAGETAAAVRAFLAGEGARISELLGRGRASMSAPQTLAFLVLDAATAQPATA